MTDPLVLAALDARERALARFSGFKVGAAIQTSDGRIYTGCNVENASLGLTVCAERIALLKALSEGDRSFTRITVATAAATHTPPCGPCRQLLWEYCGDIEVALYSTHLSQSRLFKLSDLFPFPFESKNL